MNSHRVQFYDSDAFVVKTVGAFAESAQRAGDGVIIISTRDHLASLQTVLHPTPGTLDDCVFLDADKMLATIMVNGLPDERRFNDALGGWIRRVSCEGDRRVSAFSEMVAVLYCQGNTAAAMRLEQLWENLTHHYRLNLLCAYPLSAFPDDRHRQAFEHLCAAHSHVNPIEPFAASVEPDASYRAMALLQQRVNVLESELRRQQAVERMLESQNARIAAMVSQQGELERLAGQDALTGLSNKRIFSDRLTHAVGRAARTESPLALIFIDVDQFKPFNDNYGHDAGDHLLQQVAARLKSCVRAADTVCRWGGDEFAIIAEDADAAQAGMLMQRIALAFGEPFVLSDASVEVSVSAGFSLFPDEACDAQTLLHNADAAMYRAKRRNSQCKRTVRTSVTQFASH